MNDLEVAMGDISFRHSKSLIDEIPMAYKDIDEVMENSKEPSGGRPHTETNNKYQG